MLLHENLMIFYCLLDGEHTNFSGLLSVIACITDSYINL